MVVQVLEEMLDVLSLQEMISIEPELYAQVQEMLKKTIRTDTPQLEDSSISNAIYVPVPNGHIRVLHYQPKNPLSKRPILFVPGWGVTPAGFQDFFEVLYEKVELFYIETREKQSSHMNRWKSQYTMSRKAADIQLVIDFLQLQDQDFVLMGPCWGAAVILQGLMDKSIHAPRIITVDPMHTLWFSKWFLKYIAPLIPASFFQLLRPIIKYFKLRNMHEPTQKQRATDFINSAVLWKWKRAAIQVRDFELYGNLSRISQEVLVLNGTQDAIHEQSDYPKIAAELPKGRFFFLKTGEENRERLMGLIAKEFATKDLVDGIPEMLNLFEKEIPR